MPNRKPETAAANVFTMDRTTRDLALAALVAAASFTTCLVAALVTAILFISG